jgi:hypothetical protein
MQNESAKQDQVEALKPQKQPIRGFKVRTSVRAGDDAGPVPSPPCHPKPVTR